MNVAKALQLQAERLHWAARLNEDAQTPINSEIAVRLRRLAKALEREAALASHEVLALPAQAAPSGYVVSHLGGWGPNEHCCYCPGGVWHGHV